MAKQKFLFLVCLFGTLTLFAQSAITVDREDLDQLLEEYIGEDSPGLAVGVVQEGKIVYEHYLGYANLEHKIPMSEKTRSNIASTAKQFTALMVLQLSMEGKLSLEDDIRKYIPSLYPHIEEEIKVRHLINHTSGIRDYVFILEIMGRPYWKQVGMDNDDVIELLEKQTELAFSPGTQYGYSNSGYTILAEIIERVTGESFNNYSKAFFAELGMNETAFLKGYMGVIPDRADSYSDWGDGRWLATPTVTRFNGDGFLFTTLRDQLHFEQAVQMAEQNNNALLLESQKTIPNSEITTYGFGLELYSRLGRNTIYHSGSTFGYHSHTTRFIDEGLTVFVMSNNNSIWSGNIADRVALAILPKAEKLTAYPGRINANEFNIEDVQVTGQYTTPEGNILRIVKEEGKLMWRETGNWPYELVQEEDNLFSAKFNANIKVRFNDEALVEFYPSGKVIDYQRKAYVAASMTDLEGLVGEYHSEALEIDFKISMTEDHQLTVLFSDEDEADEIEILSRDNFAADDYSFTVERDRFNRTTDILVTLNKRAAKNRFKKQTNLQFQPKIATEDGSIQVTTVGSPNGDASNILLTKNYPNGNEIWYKQFGGKSYDKASSILATDDGYLIIGSTSSYGNGNYDMFVIKTDKRGKKLWQNTYGGFYNEYGYSAEVTESGFLIKGSIQECTSNSDVFNRECTTNVWFVFIDGAGKEISSEILEEL